MKKLIVVISSLFLTVLLSSCATSAFKRVGERFPPNSDNCPLKYEYGHVGKAMGIMSKGYIQVGTLTVVRAGDTIDDKMKKIIQPDACALGGELVIMIDSNPGNILVSNSHSSFMVLRKKAN